MAVACDESRDTVSNDFRLLQLAKQYRYGIASDVDAKKAAAIYKKLSRQGNLSAVNELGSMYLNGDGVEKNLIYAVNLFRYASKRGNVKAQCNLAMLYMKGLVENRTQYRKAFSLYRQAAAKGYAGGLYGVGYMLYKGIGVEQSYKEAISYLKKGAEKKHSGCCFLLGVIYAKGFGCDQNLDKAEYYFSLSSQYGNDLAVDISKRSFVDSIRTHSTLVKRLAANVAGSSVIFSGMSDKISDFIGSWNGVVYTLDWSGKTILKSEKVLCKFKELGDSVALYVYKNDSLQTIYTPSFVNDSYMENKRKFYQKDFSWVMTKAKFKYADMKLFIKANVRNPLLREMKKPVLFVLNRIDDTSNVANNVVVNDIYYKDNTLYADLSSTHETFVTFKVYRANGMNVISSKSSDACNGRYVINIGNSLSPGNYIVELLTPDFRMSKKIRIF